MTKIHDILWLKEVDSTNEYAKRHISSLDNLSVIAAGFQTSGRGQGSRTWSSTAGENLLVSMVLKDTGVSPSSQHIISERTATAVVKMLAKHGIRSWIKPPNDIYVENRKICGILIEHSVRGKVISWSVIGIGLNVNQKSFSPEIPNPTSMVLEKNAPEGTGAFDIKTLVEELTDILKKDFVF